MCYRPTSKATYTTFIKRDIDLKLKMENLLDTSPINTVFCEVQGHTNDKEDFEYETAPNQ